MQSYTATYINSNISIILWFFCKSKTTLFPQDGSWRDWLCEQSACHQSRVGYGKQLAHKINLSQGWGQIFFACCPLQLSLRMGRPAAWWTRPGTSWSRRGCENPDQLVPGFNHQQSWHILLLTSTGWLICTSVQEVQQGQVLEGRILCTRYHAARSVRDVVLETPFLVDSWTGDRATGWIAVFQFTPDTLMNDL